jgi:hypothetical protein
VALAYNRLEGNISCLDSVAYTPVSTSARDSNATISSPFNFQHLGTKSYRARDFEAPSPAFPNRLLTIRSSVQLGVAAAEAPVYAVCRPRSRFGKAFLLFLHLAKIVHS